jgi:fructokinase
MRIGIDLGGTKIEAIALADSGEIAMRRRVATPRCDYDGTVQAIIDLVNGIETELQMRGNVGVGTPGAISPATGLIKNANSTHLIGRSLAKDLSSALGREIRLSNDANCFALSEAVDGAAAGAEVAFGVIIGTGTGAGIVIRGKVLIGSNAIAGEWGHNPFLEVAGRLLEPPEIAALADKGDLSAEACLKRYEDRMARGLAHVINILDPDVIVLGGGLSKASRLYANVPQIWSRYVFSDRVDTRLVPPLHGESSGVRGAAWLWPPSEY